MALQHVVQTTDGEVYRTSDLDWTPNAVRFTTSEVSGGVVRDAVREELEAKWQDIETEPTAQRVDETTVTLNIPLERVANVVKVEV